MYRYITFEIRFHSQSFIRACMKCTQSVYVGIIYLNDKENDI